MIYTLTLSPSLDYRFWIEEIKTGEIMHCHGAEFAPGGKGINVSRCLTALGIDNLALGFIGGWAGERVEKMLSSLNVKTDFIHIEGETRINVKVNTKEEETAFNLDGPVISDENLNSLYEKLDKLVEGDVLIMSGSTGRLHRDIYKEIINKYNPKGVLCVLDTSMKSLDYGVQAKPFLIKPNIAELSELVGRDISIEEVPEVGKELIAKYGINYILVSYGKEGSCLVTPNGAINAQAVKGKGPVLSTVGAGDCLLASFMCCLTRGDSLEDSLNYASRCASANCYLGHVPSKEEVDSFK